MSRKAPPAERCKVTDRMKTEGEAYSEISWSCSLRCKLFNSRPTPHPADTVGDQ